MKRATKGSGARNVDRKTGELESQPQVENIHQQHHIVTATHVRHSLQPDISDHHHIYITHCPHSNTLMFKRVLVTSDYFFAVTLSYIFSLLLFLKIFFNSRETHSIVIIIIIIIP